MNPYIRERIQRKLETLSDERLYQVLDYVEFLETKYAERAASPVSFFQRFAESVEDKMRVGGLSVGAITETVGILNKAANVLSGVAQSTMSVATDVASAAARAVDQVGAPLPATPATGSVAGSAASTTGASAGRSAGTSAGTSGGASAGTSAGPTGALPGTKPAQTPGTPPDPAT